MADQPDTGWVVVAEYGAVYEAELAAGRLDSAGIISRIDRRGAAGIFGLNHAGASVRGITLYVPADSLAAAREALDLAEE
ncbi:MAG: DUF2007 domain-containing protein [Gemmatimonadetes bacterium]|nr:DUF2007 domain-containing protein [Gemmatimonadota bacterium]MBT8478903.1 DUF2007 domain-containing protein [Gemmatimonadota bacterium]NNK48321.1 hypothetical protein [Gemmatimonadota bacterium]